jgi:hypothetical protein
MAGERQNYNFAWYSLANLGQKTIGVFFENRWVIRNYQYYIQYFLIGIHKNRRGRLTPMVYCSSTPACTCLSSSPVSSIHQFPSHHLVGLFFESLSSGYSCSICSYMNTRPHYTRTPHTHTHHACTTRSTTTRILEDHVLLKITGTISTMDFI